jgi:hypothetical protein
MESSEAVSPCHKHAPRLPLYRVVHALAVGSAFGAFVAAFYWYRLTPPSDSAISADLFTQLYPMWVKAGEWMREGRMPLWNPYQLGGQPFLASVLYGVLYPPNLTRLVIPAELAMEVNIVLHQWLGLVFTYLFLRCFCSRLPSALGALVFVFSGWVVFEATWFTGGIAAVPWLPLGLLAVEKIMRGRWRWCVVLTVAIGMPILAGWLQNWLYNAYATAGFAAVRLIAEGRPDWRRATWRAVPVVAGFAGGIALAAAQLLPSVELQMLGPRAPGALKLNDMLLLGFLPPGQLFAQMIDATPGNPRYGYVGLFTLPLAIIGLLSRERGTALYFAGLGVVSLLVAMSVATPFFSLFLKLPGASWFRAPFRILYLYSLAMAVLAALGTDVIAQRWARKRLIAAALLALVGADLFLATHLTSAVRPVHRLDRFDEWAPVLAFVREHQGLDRTLIAEPHAYAPPLTMKQATLRGIYGVADYEILTLGRTGEFFRAMDASIGDRRFAGVLDFRPDAAALRLLSLMSVRFIVAPVLSQDFTRLFAAQGWKRVFWRPGDLFAVYRSPRVLPRVYIASDAGSA